VVGLFTGLAIGLYIYFFYGWQHSGVDTVEAAGYMAVRGAGSKGVGH